MNLRRGDFALVYFPHSDLRMVKLRPVLVVQAENLNTGLPQVIVAMVSSNMSRVGHASRVTVLLKDPAASETGLKSDSLIMTDNLATIELQLIDRRIGRMPQMEIVDLALRKRWHYEHIQLSNSAKTRWSAWACNSSFLYGVAQLIPDP
jgi:mRNA interferase MazF